MDAELIEAAAKLCGWAREEWDGEDTEQCWAAVWPMKHGHRTDRPPFLTDAGLLALEEALLRMGWELDHDGGYRWYRDALAAHHIVRATAACMAAAEQLKHE
jgi:hypothetical protein